MKKLLLLLLMVSFINADEETIIIDTDQDVTIDIVITWDNEEEEPTLTIKPFPVKRVIEIIREASYLTGRVE